MIRRPVCGNAEARSHYTQSSKDDHSHPPLKNGFFDQELEGAVFFISMELNLGGINMKSRNFTRAAIAGCAASMLFVASGVSAQGRQTHEDMMAGKVSPDVQQIKYHGGPIMLGTNTLYIIYYGNFNDSTAQNDTKTVINSFFENIGGSGNYNVNTVYYDSSNNHISNSLAFDAANNVYADNYSLGKNIYSYKISKIVKNAISAGHLPLNPNAIYSVITSPDASTKLRGFCAYHASTTVSGQKVVYAAVPDFGGSALQSCSGSVQNYNEQNSPNDNLGADNVLDSFMHELSEAVTDPFGNAWTGAGGENGDICNFNYGTTYTAPNGTHANTHFGNRDYLVQTIYEIQGSGATGACANTLP